MSSKNAIVQKVMIPSAQLYFSRCGIKSKQ